MVIPYKLKKNDEVRIIAPSRSIKILSQETIDIAVKNLNDLGFKITFGKNVNNSDQFSSSSIEDRVSDLHDAFIDPNVKGILTVIGGYNSNQILDFIDYKLIKNNPKIICGYSDITALNTAIYTQTGLVTYLGPHFSSFGMKYGLDYTKEYFKKMLMQNESYEIISSKEWSDDLWFINQGDRKFILNPGMIGINEGKAEGVLVGGNISTFSLLCGTKYFPDLTDKILMLEAHSEIQKHHFDRLLQQIIQQPNFYRVRGILIGMFQNGSQMNYEDVGFIIKSKKELINIPVLSNVNFGHITPIATLPIGSFINFDSNETHSKINILN